MKQLRDGEEGDGCQLAHGVGEELLRVREGEEENLERGLLLPAIHSERVDEPQHEPYHGLNLDALQRLENEEELVRFQESRWIDEEGAHFVLPTRVQGVQLKGEGGLQIEKEESEEVTRVFRFLNAHVSRIGDGTDQTVLEEFAEHDGIVVVLHNINELHEYMDLGDVQQLVCGGSEGQLKKTLLIGALPFGRNGRLDEQSRFVTLLRIWDG